MSRPTNTPQPDCINVIEDQATMAPRSYHSGRANALFCDGHVSFLEDSTAMNVFHAPVTRASGEVIGRDAY